MNHNLENGHISLGVCLIGQIFSRINMGEALKELSIVISIIAGIMAIRYYYYATKKTKTMKSKFLGLNLSDAAKGVITAFLSAALLTLYNIIVNGWPTSAELLDAARVGLAAAAGYILKNWLTNSDGETFKKES